MKRMKKSDWAMVAMAALFALPTTGCAENDATIFVRQIQARARDTECVVSPDPGALINLTGRYDPLCLLDGNGNATADCASGPFRAVPLVGNGMVARGDGDLLRAESNRVQIYGIEREVIPGGIDGALLTPSLDDGGSFGAASGFVDVGSPSNPGYGITEGVLLTQTEAVAALQVVGGSATTVLVRFRLLAETLGGKDVETGIFDYPVEIRNDPGRFLPCSAVDLTQELEETDLPCDINQGDGLGVVDPRLDPRQDCFQ